MSQNEDPMEEEEECLKLTFGGHSLSLSGAAESPLVPMASPISSPNSRVLTLPLLVGTNAVVAGLEVAASVAFTFIPPLLLKSGFGETQMSVIFGIGKS